MSIKFRTRAHVLCFAAVLRALEKQAGDARGALAAHLTSLAQAREQAAKAQQEAAAISRQLAKGERKTEALREQHRQVAQRLADIRSHSEHAECVRVALARIHESLRARRALLRSELGAPPADVDAVGMDESALVTSLKLRARDLRAQELRLAAARERVDVHALEQALECQKRIEALTSAERTAGEQLDRTCAELTAVSTRRVSQFTAALVHTNGALSGLYARLSNGGDCAITVASERSLLFESGAQLEVRPEASAWKPFAHLSGGQKALAALSLSLAFHHVSPCPVYIFDEIDAALDASAVARVAAFLHELASAAAGPQLLLVTLRPQFLDSLPPASGVALLGTFTYQGATNMITATL